MSAAMTAFARAACAALLFAAAVAPTEVQADDEIDRRIEAIDAASRRAAQFLVARQSPDGVWRSQVYPQFAGGDALTPLVLMALIELPQAERFQPTIDRGIDCLTAMVGDDGRIRPPPDGLAYPIYSAAGAVVVLSAARPSSTPARDAWVEFIRRRQLTESLGWAADDAVYGGWGYARDLPRKPPSGVPLAPLAEPNLSATVFALSALRAAGLDAAAPEMAKALAFVKRCHNYEPRTTRPAPTRADGGFFFMPNDAVRNKAGVLEIGGACEHFASYGSATVDGLRALAFCGLPVNHPRHRAAWQWLANNLSATTHPGRYAPDRQSAREAPYFYYCHSLAALLAECHTDRPAAQIDKSRWAAEFAEQLIGRQRGDGSWKNRAVDVREDDPLVATALAARALSLCRRVILVDYRARAPSTDDCTRHPASIFGPQR